MARQQTRTYIDELHSIKATWFSNLIGQEGRSVMWIQGTRMSSEYTAFSLKKQSAFQSMLSFRIRTHECLVELIKLEQGVASRVYLKCPHCSYKRSELYAAQNTYACRKCLGLKYASQSESDLDRLARRIRKERFKTWGDMGFIFDANNLYEDSRYWPRPKGRWNSAFEEERKSVESLERSFYSTLRSSLEGFGRL